MNKFLLLIFIILCLFQTVNSQWFPQNSGTERFLAGIYFTDVNTGFIVGDSSTVLKTTNGGTNWQMINTGTSNDNYYYDVYFFNANTGIICGGYFGGWDYGKILKTTNGGMNWAEQYSGLNQMLWTLAFTDTSTGYCAGYDNRMLKTTNGGNNWFDISPGVTTDFWSIVFTSSSTGFAAGKYGKIYKSTNAGNNWLQLQSGTNQRIGCLYFTDANTGYAVGDSQSIIKTTNGGTNWFSQSTPGILGFESVFFTSANTGFVVGNEWQNPYYIIKKTTNAGNNWFNVSFGIGNPLFDVFFINENTGWTSGYMGTILKTINSSSHLSNLNNQIPDKFILYQNYPNPFNPVTKIRFEIPLRKGGLKGVVSLKVFDILGKEVATLVNEQLQPGTYEVTFGGSSLSSGIYFYKLTVNKFNETKRMVLIK